jgi:hypothetical protein
VVATLEVGISAAITAWLANWRYARARWPERRAAHAGLGDQADDAQPDVEPPVERDWFGRADSAGSGAAFGVGISADRSDGHVIYLDKWAADADKGEAQRGGRSRSGDPSALP